MGDLRTLLRYFRPYKTSLIIGIACIIAGVAFNVSIPLIVGNAIDANWEAITWQKLTLASLKVLGASAMSGLFLFLQRRILIAMSRHIEYDLRNDFYAALVNQPQSFFHAHRTGDLMARATNDLSAVRQMVGPMIMYGMQTLFVVVVIVPIIFAISWKLTLLLFVTMPLVSLTVKYFGQQVHTRFQQIQDFFAQITARAQENFTGVRVVRAYAQERAEIEAFKARLEAIDAIIEGATAHDVLTLCASALAAVAPTCCEAHQDEFKAEFLRVLNDCLAARQEQEAAEAPEDDDVHQVH